ncbi:nudC domain-containing protein 3 [Epargyreus clarus]|uniref:nudC domain-containing protein 3 n=1 Tax=Epargyreus clarus TaxID=520877 RepID=UPI003C2F50CD
MATSQDVEKYDEVLASILVNEKSILGFLSTIFNFLARRTDFYYVPDGQYENMGFPPGVAEELVIKVMRTCDPKNWDEPNGAAKPLDINNEIMCSTVAQEVEVVAEEDKIEDVEQPPEPNEVDTITQTLENQSVSDTAPIPAIPDDYEPPIIPTQKSSESYNGAIRENYSWSQTIMELDVTIKLPDGVKSSKDLKVTINPGDISVQRQNGEIILKDPLPYKIKTIESFWSLSEGRLLIHLEKLKERWWDKLLANEEPIDLDKIDCSRPLDELPEDHIAKVRELQWNQDRKMKGLPTSDEIRNIEILKKAWNAEGSPFKGQEFDPSVLHKN